MYSGHNAERYDGGVEEKKEEPISPFTDNSSDIDEAAPRPDDNNSNNNSNKQGGFFRMAQALLGSCGTVVDTMLGQTCQWPPDMFGGRRSRAPMQNHNGEPSRPPLSIADELKQLAMREGRYPGEPLQPERRGDIPRFLGEDAVYSFEDDEVSALSQHTLEEMTRHGIMSQQQHQLLMRRKSSANSRDMPTPTKLLRANTTSSSSEDNEAVAQYRRSDGIVMR